MELRPDAIVIATCRRTAVGGNFSGPVSAELEVLHKAIEAGCPAIDVEIESAEAISSADWEGLRARAAVVLSSRDFKGTNKLEETFERMRAFPADFYSIVGTATCLHDNVLMTRFLERHSSEYPMVGMCLGEQGLLSRILAIRAGAAFTFGSAGQGRETASGQPTFRELRDFYRVEQIDSVTKVYGVAGDPISHSLSPAVMNTAFRRENVSAVYLPLRPKSLEDLLATVKELPVDGLNVAMPFKQAMVEHLDNSDVPTQRTGACNTVVRGKDGRLFGFNTDVYGLLAALELRVPLEGARALVVGAGGAARGAVFALRGKGAEVFILNRTPATALNLAKQSGSKTVKRNELPKLSFDLILNATPVGMGADRNTPLEENELNALWVFDMVYNPIETPLLKLAQSKGLGTISGAEMFLHQSVRQFEIWTGKPAPLDAMRQVLLRQLGAIGVENASPIPTVVPPKVKAINSTAATEEVNEISAPALANRDALEAPKPEAKAPSKPVEKKAHAKPAVNEAAAKTVKKAPGKAVKTSAGATKKPPAKTASKAAAKPSAKKAATKSAAKAAGKARK
jgi:3-dehydroquinate dehydratase/shikimate dehydrogenase